MRGVNKLKKMLREGRTAFGPFLKITDPAVAEIAGLAGFDFVIIDTEHGPLGMDRAQDLVRAAELAGTTPIIRVAKNEESFILRALDIGAHGAQIPHISAAEDAVRAGSACRFTPAGDRGVCRFVRAAGYSSIERGKYFENANREVMAIGHIEGVRGVENLDAILETRQLDVVFIGPYDLSASCGFPGQVHHPVVVKKMELVAERCRKAGVVAGTFVDGVEDAKRWADAGVQYISYNVDVGMIYAHFSKVVEVRKAAPQS
jgi:4-hydroxy-2-oxoheptanedioate aldolase